MEHRDLYSGLIRLHILHHAAEEKIFGLGIIEELHDTDITSAQARSIPCFTASRPAAIWPPSRTAMAAASAAPTAPLPAGRAASAPPKSKVRELFAELFEEHHP